MFPRRTCPRCSRSIAMSKNGEIRSHYCPHSISCELGICIECAVNRDQRHGDAAGAQTLFSRLDATSSVRSM